MIRQLHSQGLNISQIARHLKLDRKTVRKYLKRAREPSSSAVSAAPSATILDPFMDYLGERLHQYPELSASRLWREIKDRGYTGSYATVTAAVRGLRPVPEQRFEVRFETPPGEQAQVDFALFKVRFEAQPEVYRTVQLFTMVLGHSRYLYGQFCTNQKMHTVLEQHIRAFEAFGGTPRHVLYDRMKTAVIDEPVRGQVNYNPQLLALLEYYGTAPRACQPYRAKTKGKIERAYRYIRQDFFLGSSFSDLEELNQRFQKWLDEVANVRVHGTTRRHVGEAFEHEQAELCSLPPWPYCAVLRVTRKISRDGMICYQGNYYSVPDGTRYHSVEVQVLPLELLIITDGQVIARHDLAPSDARGLSVMDPSHRQASPASPEVATERPTSHCHQPLTLYQAIGKRLHQTARIAS